jgi:hypothetical protein
VKKTVIFWKENVNVRKEEEGTKKVGLNRDKKSGGDVDTPG